MNKNSKTKYICFGIGVFLIFLVCMILLFINGNKQEKTACIYSYGVLIKAIPLSGAGDCEFTVNCSEGYNLIKIENGRICVKEADCPDKTCVKTGFTDSSFKPVICMPHRLEIVIKDVTDADGVTG
ncbi:MAG: NusG domain II-containing protein [Ruminiclostridium sp.]